MNLKLNCVKAKVVKKIISFKPKVMNHRTLLRLSYDPRNIIDEQQKEAQREHRELEQTIVRFQNSNGSTNKPIKKLCRFLYVIRSNIAHGEKTPRGPDLNKIKRDEEVCEAAIPILDLIIDLLLDRPSEKLGVYGTLAPGEVNYHMLEDIAGEWFSGKVKGTISKVHQLPYFEWDLSGREIDIKIFKTPNLR